MPTTSLERDKQGRDPRRAGRTWRRRPMRRACRRWRATCATRACPSWTRSVSRSWCWASSTTASRRSSTRCSGRRCCRRGSRRRRRVLAHVTHGARAGATAVLRGRRPHADRRGGAGRSADRRGLASAGQGDGKRDGKGDRPAKSCLAIHHVEITHPSPLLAEPADHRRHAGRQRHQRAARRDHLRLRAARRRGVFLLDADADPHRVGAAVPRGAHPALDARPADLRGRQGRPARRRPSWRRRCASRASTWRRSCPSRRSSRCRRSARWRAIGPGRGWIAFVEALRRDASGTSGAGCCSINALADATRLSAFVRQSLGIQRRSLELPVHELEERIARAQERLHAGQEGAGRAPPRRSAPRPRR